MTHLQYMPGDPRLVDQLVYELKSKGIFDQFRKDCISDVDTKPAYQNLRQRVESSVSSFLSRQSWKPDLNKNQLREKLRKHLLDGNYLEQGVERIVDQVVNPKVSSVFIPQVEDLVYNYLGIVRKRPEPQTNDDATTNLLPKDLEAVSPGSVHSKDDDVQEIMDVDGPPETDDAKNALGTTTVDMCVFESDTSIDKSCIPLPDEILPENIPQPDDSPPKLDLDKIELPKEPENIPLPKFDISEDTQKTDKDYFKPIDDDDSSSDTSLTRNMSPLTPIRNLNNENSCDAQQAFENDSDEKQDDKKEPCSFRFALDNKTDENSKDKTEKNTEQTNLAFQFSNQVNIKPFNTPMYDDSSNSNNLQIDYESDANSKTNVENKIPETENSEDVKKEKKDERKSSSHKSSHRSRDSQRHSSSRDKRSDSKYSTSRDSSRNDKSDKKCKSDSKSKSSHRERERSKDRSDKKDSRDSSKHRSTHKSSNSKDSSKDKSHKSSSQRSSSSKHDDKKSSSQKDRNDKNSDRSKDSRSKDKKDSRSSSHRSDKDRKSSSHKSEKDSKSDDKSKKKDKKDVDDHYSLSGRGNSNRRSTDRDSNDGSSSSKGSHNPPSSKSSESKKETKGSTSKSDNTSYSGDSTSPSDKENMTIQNDTLVHFKPAVHIDNHLELPIAPIPRLPFVPDVTIKKPKFAANLEEAKRLMKMRRFLDEEQRRMNQEAALLLEFQANVRPSLSQVYSSIPGPELEFACGTNITQDINDTNDTSKSDTPNISDDDNDEKEFMGFECAKINGQFDVNDNCDVDKDIKHIEELRKETYEENKPFSQLVNEISEYSRASERIKSINSEKNNDKIHGSNETLDDIKYDSENTESKDASSSTVLECTSDSDRTNLFEVTIITEEFSETEDTNKESEADENNLCYFAEHEKYDSEIERQKFEMFLKKYIEKSKSINKLYIINCESYAEKILRDIAPEFGDYEIVSYHKNGHLKLPKKEIIKDVDLEEEIILPKNDYESSPLQSPVKSECSFELSSDYAAKLEEMVNKTSRQEVMEIILGSVMESPSKMPKIDYYEESAVFCDNLKRKIEPEVDSKNIQVLTPNKIRKMSESDQITSTTEETDKHIPNNKVQIQRSKYLGKARRVGLPRPKKTNLPNSPSSDKSVENYEQNTQISPNGKIKTPQRTKIQRYSTTDLYKPKLHYLSRRNNIRP